MSKDYVTPKKIKKYIKRLLIDYEKTNVDLFNILKELKKDDMEIITETKPEERMDDISSALYIGYHHYHQLMLRLSKECFEKYIPFKNEAKIAKQLENDLNQSISVPDESINEVVFELKEEVDIGDFLKEKIKINPKDLTFWKPDSLRAFISHSAKNYKIAKKLKDQLEIFKISCFVAHKDIKPAERWIKEIRKALHSMEVMLLLVTEDSNQSYWVNQEIGFALSQKVPVIPIKLDQNDPKGFISEIQAITLNKEDIINEKSDTIKKLINCIKNKLPEHPFFKKHLLEKFLNARNASYAYAKETFMDIIDLKFNDEEIKNIVLAIMDETKRQGEGYFGGTNQLKVILVDEIGNEEHVKKAPGYEFYVDLLRDKILSQHTKKRYSIKELPEEEHDIVNRFKIIDNNQNTTNKKNDTSNTDNIPF